MKKERTKECKLWHLLSLVSAITLALLLFTGFRAEASTLNVGDYKGERAESEWLVPTEDGKIFAGWFEDEALTTPFLGTTGEAYAKFVDAKVMGIRKQFRSDFQSTDVTTSIRILTGIDSLLYKGVTLHVEVPESSKDWTVTETTAYSSIRVAGASEPTLPSDEAAFNTPDAKYFVLHAFAGIPAEAFGHEFVVTPSWETMDGTKVTGQTARFTVNQMLLGSSMFADRVIIGERTEVSAAQKWDISRIGQNIVTGVNLTDQDAMWFKTTGKNMIAAMTVTRKDTSATTGRESQPLAAIGFSDGTSYGHVGVRAGGVIYNGNWINGKIGKDVLATWSSAENLSVDLMFILWNGQVRVYVDGKYATSVPISDVISGAAADTELAFSLVMSAFGKNAEFEYSNLEFVADEAEVTARILAMEGYADKVTVNSKEVASVLTNWDLGAILDGTVKATSDCKMEPLMFAETGKQAYLHLTMNAVDGTAGNPMAGLWIDDGNGRAFVGIRGTGVFGRKRNAGWDWWIKDPVWSKQYLAPGWGGPASVTADILVKDGSVTISVGSESWTGPLSDLLTGLDANADLSFGLVAFTEGTRVMNIEFSDVQFATDPAEIETIALSRMGLAASTAVNGKTVNSATDKWDLTDAVNGKVRATTANGCKEQPLYFSETGSAAYLHMVVTANDGTAGDAMAALWISNGDSRAYLGIRGNGLCNSQLGKSWNAWVDPAPWSYSVLSPGWGGNKKATLDIVLKDGVFTIYLDNNEHTTLDAANLGLASGTNYAYGIMGWTDGTRVMDLTFSDIQFTTDAAAVDAFLASKAQ